MTSPADSSPAPAAALREDGAPVVFLFYSQPQSRTARQVFEWSDLPFEAVTVARASGLCPEGFQVARTHLKLASNCLIRHGLLFEVRRAGSSRGLRTGPRPVYLDHNATTPQHPEVTEWMRRLAGSFCGNPSSLHYPGRAAKILLEESRQTVAGYLGVQPGEIVFTASGSEANNLALQGAPAPEGGGTLVTSAVEHACVRNTCAFLAGQGTRVVALPVDGDGFVAPADLERAVRETPPYLVSVIFAQNEIGTLQPVRELARISRGCGALFHTDAVQALGKVRFRIPDLEADLVSISAHKVQGPKGVGALYVRKGVALRPVIHGGHQERGLRAGTENLIAIAGLAKAVELLGRDEEARLSRMAGLKNRLYQKIRGLPGFRLHGSLERSLPGTLNVSFESMYAESMVVALDFQGIAVSPGAACSSGSVEPSHVLTALGLTRDEAGRAFRISLGFSTTAREVDRAASCIRRVVLDRVRQTGGHPAPACTR